ncbi:MAG: TRAP transporter substrate-binding protein [Gammaproteobacteria bacterium]|jgi:TRAP-type mannitol/chloroaromatic compound transport system substrate-binding protein
MKRRAILYGGLGAVAGCSQAGDDALRQSSSETHSWRMVTSWPPNFPGFGASANRLAERIGELSDGRIDIEVFAAGELIPAFEVFDAVARGSMQMGHSSPTYWRGTLPAAPIFSSVPFGMLATEHKAWMDHGGGLALWREIYGAQGIVPFVAGNTGAQMGGWFNTEINSMEDLVGLKMRISGLGAEVIQRAGAVAVSLPGAELFTSLATGVIDATEWNGPFNDMAFGLQEVASYYYYPGWHEPSGVLEALISADAYEALSPHLRSVVDAACRTEADYVIGEFAARNQQALRTLTDEHGIELRRFPTEVLTALRAISVDVMQKLAAADSDLNRAYTSYRAYADSIGAWHEISEGAHTGIRRG